MTDTLTPLFDLESAFLDTAAIDGGRWLPLGADFPGVEIHARGLSSPDAQKLRSHLQRTAPKADRLANGKLTDDTEERILKAVVARKCVTDWRGLGSGGKPVPFSVETLEGLLNQPRARLLSAAIINAIVDLEQTRANVEASVVGN